MSAAVCEAWSGAFSWSAAPVPFHRGPQCVRPAREGRRGGPTAGRAGLHRVHSQLSMPLHVGYVGGQAFIVCVNPGLYEVQFGFFRWGEGLVGKL